MTWNKMKNQPKRIQIGHFSVNINEVCKTTELTGKQRVILSKFTVEAPPIFFEFLPNTSNTLTIFTNSITLLGQRTHASISPL